MAPRCATVPREAAGAPTRPRSSPTARAAGATVEGDAVVVGLGDREHARPRDGAPARAALRTPRRDRHRLHDPVSVDDARRTSRSPTTSSSACGAAPRTGASPTCSRRTAIARPSARWSRCSIRSSRSTSSSTRCASSASRPRCSPVTRATRPAADGAAYRLDTFGVDSAFDYDPLWAKCVELGDRAGVPQLAAVAPRHALGDELRVQPRRRARRSHESLCKSLFLSGVTHRFPDAALRLPRRRRRVGVQPARRPRRALGEAQRRRDRRPRSRSARRRRAARALRALRRRPRARRARRAARVLRAVRARRPSSSTSSRRRRSSRSTTCATASSPNFYFGCEADDRLVAWAFATNVNPAGARLRPIFGSDISHWDVPDMTEPVEEAYELVERGIGGRQFRELTFLNPARLHAGMNPEFFDGTGVEAAAAEVVAAGFEEGLDGRGPARPCDRCCRGRARAGGPRKAVASAWTRSHRPRGAEHAVPRGERAKVRRPA